MLTLIACAALAAFAAGFVDAVVGGGGLIQLPALLFLLPTVPFAVVSGTNKFASVWGTLAAFLSYRRQVPMRWRFLLPCAACAFVGSYLGAGLVTALPSSLIKPVIMALIAAVAVFTYFRKNFGAVEKAAVHGKRALGLALAVGAAIGFYDGAVGPGTGNFLIFLFVGLAGFNFLTASAHAKFVNLMTNIAALSLFIPRGLVRYDVALAMALANAAGGLVGSRWAVRHGSGAVRKVFLGIAGLLALKLAYEAISA